MIQRTQVEQDSILLTMPFINLCQAPLQLPLPTAGNTGGFVLSIDNTIYAYSPIDLSIASLTALFLREPSITDLSKWFINHTSPIAELWVTCTTSTDGVLQTSTIAEYKQNKTFRKLFKKAAPFTFRNL